MIVSEKTALERFRGLKKRFRVLIAERYEHRARSCSNCSTPGAWCLDAHFVNVRISRLEAKAIRERLQELSTEHQDEVYGRIDKAIGRFKLDLGPDLSRTFACPLFEKESGCLVHDSGKPLPCISHACYEKKEHLPPDSLLDEAELAVDRLNRKVYGRQLPLMPLPVAIRNVMR